MITILVTGFEPFGNSDCNPSAEVVAALAAGAGGGVRLDRARPDGGLRIATAVLPVDAARAPGLLLAALASVRPDAVVLLGEARSRARLGVERVAINLLDFAEPDNAGARRVDEPVVPGGPAAYFATLPVRALVAAIRAAGVPAELSLSAGSYLCNQTMYVLLHQLATTGSDCPAGFIHLPALPRQVTQTPFPHPSMEAATALAGVRAGLACLAQQLSAQPLAEQQLPAQPLPEQLAQRPATVAGEREPAS
jgi:pyroglutamyl-peptidase